MKQLVEIQGEPLSVQIFDAGNSKADVLLIHGFTGSKEDFSEIGPLISDAGFRVLTFDNRGQHESSHTKREDGYSMPSLARDAIELAGHFKMKNPHLLGHSFGGLIAQHAVVLAPTIWSSLTLLCSGPSGRSDWLDEPQFNDLNNSNKVEIWEKVLAPERRENPRFDLLKKRWIESDADATMIYRNHLLGQHSLIPTIATTGISAHVIYGENDDAWPIEEQNLMARDLTAKISVLPECGHSPNIDNPKLLTNALVEFWKQNKS